MEKQGGRAKNEAWETSIKKKSLGGNVQRAKAKPGDCGMLATKGKSCMKQGEYPSSATSYAAPAPPTP